MSFSCDLLPLLIKVEPDLLSWLSASLSLSSLCLCPFTFFTPTWNFRCCWQAVPCFRYTEYHARGLCLEKQKRNARKYVQGKQNPPALWNPLKAASRRCSCSSLDGSGAPRATAPQPCHTANSDAARLSTMCPARLEGSELVPSVSQSGQASPTERIYKLGIVNLCC